MFISYDSLIKLGVSLVGVLLTVAITWIICNLGADYEYELKYITSEGNAIYEVHHK